MLSFASTGSLKTLDTAHSQHSQPTDADIPSPIGSTYTNNPDGFYGGEGAGAGAGGGADTDMNLPVNITAGLVLPDEINIELSIQRHSEALKELISRRGGEPLFLTTLNTFMATLEASVERTMNEQLVKIERRAIYEKNKNTFISEYLARCPYFYLPEAKLFIEYQCETFSVVQESRIWSDILTAIEADEFLLPYKYKIRAEVLQLVRQRHLWRCTPESSTIQGVLHLLTSFFFANKEQAKYFLTIVGDDLFGKIGGGGGSGGGNLAGSGGSGEQLSEHQSTAPDTPRQQPIYVCNDTLTPLLNTLSYQFSRYIKHKIHGIFKGNISVPSLPPTQTQTASGAGIALSVAPTEVSGETASNSHSEPASCTSYSLQYVRVLNSRPDIPDQEYWEDHVRNKILDIIAVAFHYSLRFENAENFLETYCSLPSVYNQAHSLSDVGSIQQLIHTFLGLAGAGAGAGGAAAGNSGETEQPTAITNSDISFLWKCFISGYSVNDTFLLRPAVKFIHEMMSPAIGAILSNKLRVVYGFKAFIHETMTQYSYHDEYSSKYSCRDVYVYEIDELLKVFRMWCQLNRPEISGDIHREIGTDQLLKMITHYYAGDIQLEDNKMVYKWKCSMWDKPVIIIEYLETAGREHKYTDFCKFLKERQITLIPSKAYYDKIVECSI